MIRLYRLQNSFEGICTKGCLSVYCKMLEKKMKKSSKVTERKDLLIRNIYRRPPITDFSNVN